MSCEAQSLQVGLALRSDSIVLVQLADYKHINYTIQVNVDEDYRNFMAMRRHDQTDLPYLEEYKLYMQDSRPIYNYTLTHPVQPVTNFHYAHVLARNIRPLIEQAELELGGLLKCDAIVIPIYAGINNYTPFVQLASELAGCGSIGFYQIKNLYNAIAWAHDLDVVNGKRQRFRPGQMKYRISILFEIEPSHIRVRAINITPAYAMPHCAIACDRTDLTLIDSLLICVAKFRRDCVLEDKTFNSRTYFDKIGSLDIQKVFVSGGLESQQETIMDTIHSQFGISPLDGTSLGINAELLGAYGAAYWASFSGKHEYKRDLHSWNTPMFRDRNEHWYNGTVVSAEDIPHGCGY